MVDERRKRARDEDSDEEDPLSKNDPDRDFAEDLEPKRPRSTRRCAQNRKPITEEPTDSEAEEPEEEVAEAEDEEEEDAEEEYNSEDFQEEEEEAGDEEPLAVD
ncbi:hypothetical protein, conserved [Babesia bigemina]|uniref:Uncharacterized protein n=1 Tax=Babesia bigemina TaxID=5866 RepID=A0A061D779_BABBI|nr:hypothetical protein, conserved [Babesia bigemina]CDR96571.1 hypothetical protein, conserved [Babesia bigemina]|eukprot:XP_012768757.1 hypothetical protein, conserved [Babesia bigemina]